MWSKISLEEAKEHEKWKSYSGFKSVIDLNILFAFGKMGQTLGLIEQTQSDKLYPLLLPPIILIVVLLVFRKQRSKQALIQLLAILWGYLIVSAVVLLSVFKDTGAENMIAGYLGQYSVGALFWSVILIIYTKLSKTYRLQYKLEVKK